MIVKTFFQQTEGPYDGFSVIKFDEDRAHLLCDCGSEFSLRLKNNVKNEGRFRCRECYAVASSRLFDPLWGEKTALKRIRSDAYAASRVFQISLDWFVDVCKRPCHYCGALPNNTVRYKSNSGRFARVFEYNGLDRVENSIGYVEENCVPCCIICNRAKNNMGYQEFVTWLNSLVQHRARMRT